MDFFIDFNNVVFGYLSDVLRNAIIIFPFVFSVSVIVFFILQFIKFGIDRWHR